MTTSQHQNKEGSPLLRVKNLSLQIKQPHRNFMAIQNVSFSLNKGASLALVGESGCGKTLTALALMGLLPKQISQISGEIWFRNKMITAKGKDTFGQLRGKHITMIFQEPVAALNPVFQVGAQISDVVRTHLMCSSKAAKSHTKELFGQVGFANPGYIYKAYPHQLSGGMAQRVMIAMALSCDPQLIIADEPTTALDVISQMQILELIKILQMKHKFALLLISHDIKMVSKMANSILVMHAGKIIERGKTVTILSQPVEQQTQKLVQSIFELQISLKKNKELWQV